MTRARPQDTRDAGDETVAESQPRPVSALEQTAPLQGGAAVLPRGTALDENYVVEELLGRGAMGAVYLVRHRALGKEFAAKVVSRAAGLDAASVARLRNEARMASAIDHENIVGVTHLGTLADGSVFVVMERLRGEDLRARLMRQSETTEPWLPDDEVRGLVPPLLGALGSAHAAGIVHRDLKPENVFLHHRRGRVTPKLVDFGIGKLRDPSEELRLTATGQIVGTPLYMSPEQARSSDLVDARSDLYTMGVVLHELLTGRLPFEASNLYEIILKHVSEAPRDPRELRPDLPPKLAELVLRCLRKAPDERFQSADELLHAWREAWDEPADLPLATSYDGEPPAELRADGRTSSGPRRLATPTAPVPHEVAMGSTIAAVVEPKRSRAPLVLGLVGLGLVVGLVAWAFGGRDDTVEARLASEPTRASETTARETVPAETVPAETVPTMASEPVLEEPTPEPPTPAPLVHHRIESEPLGASVFRGDVELGVTPLAIDRAADETIELELRRRGFESISLTVDASSDEVVRASLRRARRARPAFPELAPR